MTFSSWCDFEPANGQSIRWPRADVNERPRASFAVVTTTSLVRRVLFSVTRARLRLGHDRGRAPGADGRGRARRRRCRASPSGRAAASRILVVAWASSEPAESTRRCSRTSAPCRPDRMEMAPSPPLGAGRQGRLGRQMGARAACSSPEATRPASWTSCATCPAGRCARATRRASSSAARAGTACMSSIMITGDGDLPVIDAEQVGVRAGLGLLPNVIVDRHFIKRQRENASCSA